MTDEPYEDRNSTEYLSNKSTKIIDLWLERSESRINFTDLKRLHDIIVEEFRNHA